MVKFSTVYVCRELLHIRLSPPACIRLFFSSNHNAWFLFTWAHASSSKHWVVPVTEPLVWRAVAAAIPWLDLETLDGVHTLLHYFILSQCDMLFYRCWVLLVKIKGIRTMLEVWYTRWRVLILCSLWRWCWNCFALQMSCHFSCKGEIKILFKPYLACWCESTIGWLEREWLGGTIF